MRHRRMCPAALAVLFVLLPASALADGPSFSNDEIRRFLLGARVIDQRRVGKGVTNPWRLTLTDGRLTHDAAFQTIDERETLRKFDRGGVEVNFTDSYHYNIAAFDIAELLGLDSMVPVAVERRWRGEDGAMVWWIDAQWDDAEVRKAKLEPPDPAAWNAQRYRARVFAELVYDTDRNLGNNLITSDWRLWLVDFTRAFRVWPELRRAADLNRCDRELFAKLHALTEDALARKTEQHLSRFQVRALLARRDKILAHFKKLIGERGENNVLY
jgi:hypothetical protein